MARKKVTFEDLAKLAQQSRNPCGKQAYSKRGVKVAAYERNQFTQGKTYYPTVCFDGCGRSVFHLTTAPPTGRVKVMFEKMPGRTAAERARRKRGEKKRRRGLAVRSEICAWENEGGSYGD